MTVIYVLTGNDVKPVESTARSVDGSDKIVHRRAIYYAKRGMDCLIDVKGRKTNIQFELTAKAAVEKMKAIIMSDHKYKVKQLEKVLNTKIGKLNELLR